MNNKKAPGGASEINNILNRKTVDKFSQHGGCEVRIIPRNKEAETALPCNWERFHEEEDEANTPLSTD